MAEQALLNSVVKSSKLDHYKQDKCIPIKDNGQPKPSLAPLERRKGKGCPYKLSV